MQHSAFGHRFFKLSTLTAFYEMPLWCLRLVLTLLLVAFYIYRCVENTFLPIKFSVLQK